LSREAQHRPPDARGARACEVAAATARRAGLLMLSIAAVSCGSDAGGPSQPSGPKTGGTISGRYALELQPAASCRGRAVTFTVEATQSASAPHPGSQLLLAGVADPALLETELKYTDNTLEGGIGTTGDGYPSIEGPQVWVNAIASGKTTQTSDGRGEVVSGTLRGYVEIEGVMDACTSPAHAFTLRAK
jgi:hypothetical protein